jgi:nucleoside-diphosphate-sugar epimerase
MQDKVLVIGSSGQIGSELVAELRSNYGDSNVIASDIVAANQTIIDSGPFEILDVTDSNRLHEIVKKYKVTHVYLLAAILSAKPFMGP